ncbi:WxL domain-containing protein [endosymbiont 'TC1' of Trimyema compressum]|uniref:WxL domain-containing protein n=1 Tax=endosymbiont 'TC1' of Trimyema compressum TaxID=243899 RepID=UPI001392283B|nr:WxL domain-containing protein [endosymbiont 'TC1' of Trimyema compressum]
MKKLFIFFLISACCLFMVATIYAEDKTVTSDATVIFIADTDSTNPVNPENPDQTSYWKNVNRVDRKSEIKF